MTGVKTEVVIPNVASAESCSIAKKWVDMALEGLMSHYTALSEPTEHVQNVDSHLHKVIKKEKIGRAHV